MKKSKENAKVAITVNFTETQELIVCYALEQLKKKLNKQIVTKKGFSLLLNIVEIQNVFAPIKKKEIKF